ncbi:MAG: hypothetical protein QME51_00735 [Planctomycetota bacterium]|nr:hypothetical protein [Planctomycetota bacterium]MDI6786883.1 hypothetical protein [Planctomycetota bacterium]
MILTRRLLRQMADERSFERGEDYADRGLVGEILSHENSITAKVRGTQLYKVKLWAEDEELGFSCTCPVYAQDEFCKHCVAVGLSYLSQNEPSHTKPKPQKPVVTTDDIRTYLSQQDKDVLVNMIMEQALESDHLREKLLMKSARQSGKDLNLTAFHQAIDNAVNTGDFVDYQSAWDYTQNVNEVIDSIAELLKEGYANETIELTEYFLSAVEDQMGNIDDSDGGMGDILSRLQELHHQACQKAKPDPEALAKRLFEWEINSDWEVFFGAAETYADILGEKGLAIYRQLAEDQWNRLPPLLPGQSNHAERIDRFRITSIMETLAKDIEGLVSIKSRDLSSAYSYLQIAEIYKNARQYDKALKWAKEGIKAFPERTDSRLREFLANEYHRLKRHPEAVELIWKNFTEAPYLNNYQSLKQHADKSNQWLTWREKALDFLHQSISQKRKKEGKDWWHLPDHSELVRILIWEKKLDDAWKEAKAGGCSNNLWLELAAKREQEHPADALEIYQKQIEPIIEQKNNQAYTEAVGLLKKVKRLMNQLGIDEQFAHYLSDIRTRHKPKRNFMKLVDRLIMRGLS